MERAQVTKGHPELADGQNEVRQVATETR